jgi:hypothetical protein
MTAKNGPPSEIRSVIAQGAIALMVCIGGYMFLVDPQATKLAAAKAQEASLLSQASATESLRDMAPQITAALARSKSESERIYQTGRLARQEQELYASLTSVANTCRVRIDQMSPNKLSGPVKPGQAAQNPTDSQDGGPNAAVGYTIDATATYSDIADFLKAIRTELGYSIVRSVRMTPTSDTRQKLVHALIETEHFSFDASPVEPVAPGTPAGPGGH